MEPKQRTRVRKRNDERTTTYEVNKNTKIREEIENSSKHNNNRTSGSGTIMGPVRRHQVLSPVC